jgi:hypothetical protein
MGASCEINRGCRTCKDHPSLPRFLLAEANEIALFLSLHCFADEPAAFLRLCLIVAIPDVLRK